MNPLIGTCSWNYPSWKELVYSKTEKRAADYLPEYSREYSTAEIYSWFYKLPGREETENYLSKVDTEFRITARLGAQKSLLRIRTFYPMKYSKTIFPQSNPCFRDLMQ